MPALEYLAKALAIQGDYRRVFHLANVYTDLRPVFRRDPQVPPLGVLVAHELKLEYFASGRLEALFITLDDADLQTLAKVIERAQAKRTGVMTFLSQAGLTRMEPQE